MKKIISALCVLSCASPVFARDASSFLTVSNDVPREQANLIKSDLQRLSTLPISVTNPEFAKVLDMSPAITNTAMLEWLAQRIHYVVNEDFEISEKNMSLSQDKYNFQNPGIFPDLPTGMKSPGANPGNAGTVKVQTVMSNIGSAVYLAGKMSDALISVKIPGKFSKVPMTTPRIGILQVGKGMFSRSKGQPATSSMQDLDSSLMRLGTLFHEARHSDGNGKSLGMLHAKCPEGHAFEGYGACDFSLNGSYSVGAVVGKIFAETCATCTVGQKESLRLDYLDSYSRVITEKAAPDSVDKGNLAGMTADMLRTMKGTCEILLKYGPTADSIELCAGIDQKIANASAANQSPPPKLMIKAQFVDSRPEGI